MADLDELKATQAQVIAAINRRDLDGWLALLHDDVIYRDAFAPLAVEGKAALRHVAAAQLSRSESVTVTLINPQYRVFERTGIVCGHSVFAVKPKDGPLQTTFVRNTGAYTKVAGKWRLAALHLSRISSGDEIKISQNNQP